MTTQESVLRTEDLRGQFVLDWYFVRNKKEIVLTIYIYIALLVEKLGHRILSLRFGLQSENQLKVFRGKSQC